MLCSSLLRRSLLSSSPTSSIRGVLQASRPPRPRVDPEGSFPAPLNQLSEREEAFVETVRRFSQDVVRPLVREMDEASELHPTVVRGAFENGLMGIEVPEQYGGPGCSFFDAILVIEELAKVDPSVSLFVDIQNTLVFPLILEAGTEEQREKYLSRMCTDWVGAFCLSESGSGSDAFALKASAKEDGDDYILNGEKLWITNAVQANFFLVFATTNPAHGYKGITCFFVDRDAEGVSLGKKEDKLGIRASSTCPVILDNVRVHKSAILGENGRGYRIATDCVNAGRIGIAAQMLGLAQGCFDATLPYLNERKQFGTRLIDFQGMAFQVSEVGMEIEAARMLVYNAARLKQAGLPFVKHSSMAKLCSALAATKTTSKCVEWMGGVGFTKEFPIEKYYRDAKIGSIYGGTNNMQMGTIFKFINSNYRNSVKKAGQASQ